MKLIRSISDCFIDWRMKIPFPHAIIDDFFPANIAERLSAEFPSFDSPIWHEYNNSLEIKKTCNNWHHFPAFTYQVFEHLNSAVFLADLSEWLNIELFADPGLNGGGWHIHAQGGKLNPHLDYSMHPKLPCQRKINLLCYLNKNWKEEWGGHLGIYRGNHESPGELEQRILPKYNRAIFFDTTMNSWHGLCEEITCPMHEYRKSIALYYLSNPALNTDPRSKALFYPVGDQIDDPEIKALIKARANVKTASLVYKK